jgi:hypothetical protein
MAISRTMKRKERALLHFLSLGLMIRSDCKKKPSWRFKIRRMIQALKCVRSRITSKKRMCLR